MLGHSPEFWDHATAIAAVTYATVWIVAFIYRKPIRRWLRRVVKKS